MTNAKNIDERKTEYGIVYRVRFNFGGKTYTATRDRLGDAINWRDETKELLRSGQSLPGEIPTGDMTLGQATDKFIKSAVGKAHGTTSGYIFAQTQLIKYFGEKCLLSKITPLRMTEFVDHRRQVDAVGASKIYQELSFIRQVYNKATTWGINLPSPELAIKRPRRPTPSREDKLDRVIKPKEMVALLETVFQKRKDLYYFLLFLLYSGMRPSEAASLRWERMNKKEEQKSKREKQHIGHTDFERGGFGHIGTKTESRFVPGHPTAIKVIKHLRKSAPKENAFVFIPDNHGQRNSPYLFYRRAFRNAKETTRLPDGNPLRKDIDFYSFRHTARSRMAICRVQDSAAEVILGHEGRNTMQKTYTHYEDEDLVREIARLDYPWLELLF